MPIPPPSDYQTFRRPCDRPRFRSWGGQKPKQLNTSCSQYTTRIAGVKYPKYKCEKAEKKLVENWKKCPHCEHLLDDEKGTTEKNSTLLHCVSPVSSFVLSLWGIGKTPVVLCIISGLQFPTRVARSTHGGVGSWEKYKRTRNDQVLYWSWCLDGPKTPYRPYLWYDTQSNQKTIRLSN